MLYRSGPRATRYLLRISASSGTAGLLAFTACFGQVASPAGDAGASSEDATASTNPPGCGGCVGTSSGGYPGSGSGFVTGGTSSGGYGYLDAETSDADVPGVSDDATGSQDAATGIASASCESAPVLGLGQSLSATTCGGAQLLDESPCQLSGHPVSYFSVDVPAGVNFAIHSTAPVAVLAFASCTTTTMNCSFSGTSFQLDPDYSGLRVFAVERNDVTCGDFTIPVAKQ